MTKLKMSIEIEYNSAIMHSDDPASKKWFYEDVLGGELVLHSNEIGDEIGIVKVLSINIEPHNNNVEVYNNGYGNRIALEIFSGMRVSLTLGKAKALLGSLEYGIAKAESNQPQKIDQSCKTCKFRNGTKCRKSQEYITDNDWCSAYRK